MRSGIVIETPSDCPCPAVSPVDVACHAKEKPPIKVNRRWKQAGVRLSDGPPGDQLNSVGTILEASRLSIRFEHQGLSLDIHERSFSTATTIYPAAVLLFSPSSQSNTSA